MVSAPPQRARGQKTSHQFASITKLGASAKLMMKDILPCLALTSAMCVFFASVIGMSRILTD
jgi:hypothetical protein